MIARLARARREKRLRAAARIDFTGLHALRPAPVRDVYRQAWAESENRMNQRRQETKP